MLFLTTSFSSIKNPQTPTLSFPLSTSSSFLPIHPHLKVCLSRYFSRSLYLVFSNLLSGTTRQSYKYLAEASIYSVWL
ncbi:hypothetical protein QVD17_37124 [Tagetes erecta]|uniref:Uncharacterized protein n=1 Tax=Tagetes erecta TaxID=13708 RepID=A0AAD8JTZ6_TARER|nr:hypothetical protein QVD17_37124 [Tagetes erecta]